MQIQEAKRIAFLLGYEDLEIVIGKENSFHIQPPQLELTVDADLITLLHELGHQESEESLKGVTFDKAIYYVALSGMIMETKPEAIGDLPSPQVLIEAINQAIKCEVDAWLNADSFLVSLEILGEELPTDFEKNIRIRIAQSLNSYLENELMSEGAFDQLPAVKAARALMNLNDPEAFSKAFQALLQPVPRLKNNVWIPKGDETEDVF